MSKSNSDELFQDQVARIIGTAILKNDKNYTDDMMALIAQHTATKVREARIDGAIMGAKFGNAAFRQQSIAEPGKAINLDKVRDSGIKQAVAWARENL